MGWWADSQFGARLLHSAPLFSRDTLPPPLPPPAGAWKLAGFAFAAGLDYRAPDQLHAFDYSERDPSLLLLASQVGVWACGGSGLESSFVFI